MPLPDHITIPFYKRLFSYVYPQLIKRGHTTFNPILELYLSSNQFQLGVPDALYSDGDRYMPAIIAAKHAGTRLTDQSRVLVLGSGIGSIIHVLHARKRHPHFTLVENDKEVLNWAIELLDKETRGKLNPVCTDAGAYMQQNQARYDLVFIDVFTGREVPAFVCTEEFLTNCRKALLPGGLVAFNYMVLDKAGWLRTYDVFSSVFKDAQVVESGMNRMLIGRL